MATFFALTRIPKAQQAGDGRSRFDKPAKRQEPTWVGPEPFYKAEIEVTRAIAAGTFKVCDAAPTTDAAYKQARAWEKFQKTLNRHFCPKQAKPRPAGSHNFTMSFGK